MPSDYSPDLIPADWNLAFKHGQASKPGIHTESHSKEVCPCCFNFVEKRPIQLSEDNAALAFLGNGFPLFYNFFKSSIIMLLALVLNCSVVSTDLNYIQNACAAGVHPTYKSEKGTAGINGCVDGYANSLSYVRDETPQAIRQVLKVTAFLTQLVLLIYLRKRQISLVSYYDQRSQKVSDFSIRIKNVPLGNKQNAAKLAGLIQSLAQSNMPIEIHEMQIIQNLQQYYTKMGQLHSIVSQKKKVLSSEQTPLNLSILDNKQQLFWTEVAEFREHMLRNEDSYFVGKCFVIFQTQAQRDFVHNAINNSLTPDQIRSFFPNYDPKILKRVKSVKGREPNQIIWRNIHKSRGQRAKAIVLGWLIFLICLGTFTVILFFALRSKSLIIENAIHNYQKDPTKYKFEHDGGIALGYASVVVIVLFNKFCMPWVCHHFTDLEKHANWSQYEYSFGLKYSLGLFFTTAFMTLAVEAYFLQNYVSNFGVVEAESLMFVLNAFIPPLFWLINPYFMTAKYRRSKLQYSEYLTQHQANQLMEDPPYQVGKRYSEIIKTMWFTFLYAYLIPVGAMFSLAGLCLYYLVDRRVLLRMSSVNRSVSFDLARFMLKMVDLTLFFFALGIVLFDYSIRGVVYTEDWILLGASLLYLILPLNRSLRWIFNEKRLENVARFSDLKSKLTVTYKTSYPLNLNRNLLLNTIQVSPQIKSQSDLSFVKSANIK